MGWPTGLRKATARVMQEPYPQQGSVLRCLHNHHAGPREQDGMHNQCTIQRVRAVLRQRHRVFDAEGRYLAEATDAGVVKMFKHDATPDQVHTMGPGSAFRQGGTGTIARSKLWLKRKEADWQLMLLRREQARERASAIARLQSTLFTMVLDVDNTNVRRAQELSLIHI